jgi:hypothetical protein
MTLTTKVKLNKFASVYITLFTRSLQISVGYFFQFYMRQGLFKTAL